MTFATRISRLLFVSPWLLPVFLIIPLLVILSVTLNVQLFPFGSTKLLLINNICFALLSGCRLIRYLARYNKTIRYGAAYRRPSKSSLFVLSHAEARSSLARSGYCFDSSGTALMVKHVLMAAAVIWGVFAWRRLKVRVAALRESLPAEMRAEISSP